LVDVGVGIGPVDLVEVDPVGAQPSQAVVDLLRQPPPGVAPAVGVLPHREVGLGGQDHLIPAAADQRLGHDLLGLPARVDVGRVDEVDPGVEGPVDDPDRFLVVRVAPGAEHHGPEAHRAHLHAGTTECPHDDERYPTRPPAKAPGPASVPPYSFGWTSSAIIPLVCPQFDRWADQIDCMTPRAGSGAPGCGVPARRPSPPTPSRRRLFAFTAARLSSSAPRTDRSQVSRSATKRFTRTLHTDGHPHSQATPEAPFRRLQGGARCATAGSPRSSPARSPGSCSYPSPPGPPGTSCPAAAPRWRRSSSPPTAGL